MKEEGGGTTSHPTEEINVREEIPREYQCVECGEEESGLCSCCGRPLCHIHLETQAGFCSAFSTYVIDGEKKTGCKIGEKFVEMEKKEG